MSKSLQGERADLRQLLAVFVFAVAAGMSGLFAAPPLDRDESRFIQATTQMIETGDYVVIRYQDLERNKKPIGIHWLQAASVQAFGGPEAREVWKYRIPSLLAAGLAACATYLIGCALFSRRAGLVAGILLAGAPVIVAEATIAKTDAALLATIVLAQLALARAWTGEARPRHAVLFWLALSAGVLIKGPIAPMVVGLTGLAASAAARRVRWVTALRPLLGAAALLILVLPWFVAIGFATDGRFYAEAVGTDMLGKVGEAQESHAGPPGYHLALFWALFWPAALFAPLAVRWAAPRWRAPGVLFCLAWIAPSWLVFELAGTKLPHYPMVLYPAIALLAGAAVTTLEPGRFMGWRWAGLAVYLLVGIAAAIGAVYLLVLHQDGGPTLFAYGLAGVVIAATIATAVATAKGRLERGALMAAATSAALGWVLFQYVLPRLDELAVTPRLEASLATLGAHPRTDSAPAVALVGYHEPSAVFRLGTPTLLTDAQGAADWLRGGSGRIAVVEDRHRTDFLTAATGVAFEEVGAVEGLNYSNGDDVRLVIVRSR